MLGREQSTTANPHKPQYDDSRFAPESDADVQAAGTHFRVRLKRDRRLQTDSRRAIGIRQTTNGGRSD
jgi:hypothetical protein